MTNAGRFVWFELLSTDPAGSIEFYTHVTGWMTQKFGAGYTMFVSSQGPLGGVSQLPKAAAQMGAPTYWQANIEVANVDEPVALVKELGGKVFMAETVPDVGVWHSLGNPSDKSRTS